MVENTTTGDDGSIRIKTCRNCEQLFPTADRAVGVALCSPACEKQYFSNLYDYRQSETFDQNSYRPRVAPFPVEQRRYLLRHCDDQPVPAVLETEKLQKENAALRAQIERMQSDIIALKAKLGSTGPQGPTFSGVSDAA